MTNNYQDKEIQIDVDGIMKDEDTIFHNGRRSTTSSPSSSLVAPFPKWFIVSIVLVLLIVFTYIFMSVAEMDKSNVAVNEEEDLENIHARLNAISSSLETSYGELRGRLDQLEYDISVLNSNIDRLQARNKSFVSTGEQEEPSSSMRYHTVQRGENQYRIARRYGMSFKELCEINNMTEHDIIVPGQKLIVR